MADQLELRFRRAMTTFHLAHHLVLVAVSAGSDSMALITLLQRLPERERPRLAVAYVDHQLRTASQAETAYIVAYCHRHRLPLYQVKWAQALHPKTGIEAAARDFRYAFFNRVMQANKIPTLITAHHADDQAETVIQKLIRGGRVNRLQGIQPSRSFGDNLRIIRPLLGMRKEELRTYAIRHHVRFFDDETNGEDDVQRNRIRHHIIPQLEQENPVAVAHINMAASGVQQLLTAVKWEVDREWPRVVSPDRGVSCQQLQRLPAAIQAGVLDRFAPAMTIRQRAQVEQLAANLQRPDGMVNCGSFFIIKDQGWLVKIKQPSFQTTSPFSLRLTPGSWVMLPTGGMVGLFERTECPVEGPSLLVPAGPLTIRSRQPGDRLITRTGHQRVKRVLQAAHVPGNQRVDWPVVVMATGEVIAVLGIKYSDLSLTGGDARIGQYIVVYRSATGRRTNGG
ncbi:tRNA lysidine(34) synthetase TilS [Ligilactobacillus sp. LYQ139]|uniref:tRNA lysidine(34) synthetase TilS n=1 Tax=Ligilactobacillus sp. LYQ139 TaxID=3378800 RepID=UPI003852AB97